MPFNMRGANAVFNHDYIDNESNYFAPSNEMPEGPAPHKSPYVYVPPHSISPRFTGQEVYLDQLQVCFNLSQSIGQTQTKNRFRRAKSSIIKCFGKRQKLPDQENNVEIDRQWALLYGTGGVGKTQLALKFAEKHSRTFWRIFWIDASSVDTMELGLKTIAEDTEAKVAAVESSATAVLRWLSGTRRRWLLIYDNADGDPEEVEKYVPTGTGRNILFTSRNPSLARFIPHEEAIMEVVDMDEDEATSLLLKWVSPQASSADVQASARAIVRELSCLPLAVDQAGAAISSGLCTVDVYLTLYKSRHKDLMKHFSFKGASNYGRAAWTTWDLSYDVIQAGALGRCSFISPDAADSALLIIDTFAFLHYDKISEEIIKRAAESRIELSWGGNEAVATGNDGERAVSTNGKEFLRRLCRCFMLLDDKRAWDPFPFREGIRILRSFSLIKTDTQDQSYSIHPLVHLWSRDRMPDEDRKSRSCSASALLAHSIKWHFSAAHYAFRRDLIPHIQSCRAHKAATFTSEISSENEFRNFALAYHENGFYKEAEELQMRVLEMSQAALGAEHPDTLKSMARLALSYKPQGRLNDAEELEVRVLQLRQTVLGGEHPGTLTSMTNLALTYYNQGRLKEAEELQVRELELRQTVSGAEHRATLTSMANLASIYHKQGRLKEAEEVQVRELELSKRVSGAEHPHTLSSMANLAVTWKNLGRDHDAKEMMQKVVVLRSKVLGANHPHTLDSIQWLTG